MCFQLGRNSRASRKISLDAPGYLLREARERAGLSQKQMAERLGCSQQAVARAERPDSNPTVAFLKAWAEALGQTLEISFEDRRG